MKKILQITIATALIILTGCTPMKPEKRKAMEDKKKAATAANLPKPEEPEPEPEPLIQFDSTKTIPDTESKAFADISAMEAVKDMRTGWCLGNTLDATGGGNSILSETSWGQPKTTQDMIHNLAKSGIKTLRIPISWSHHMDKTNYTVNGPWMQRVKQIVDWAIAEDMYVIINCHHDVGESMTELKKCNGYYPNTKNYEESERFLVNLWSQICITFNNGYDQHLIFETMNEPRLKNTTREWWFDSNATMCRDAAACLNKLNQVCVDTIRGSGGNNQKRFIMIPALQASPDSALTTFFKMPSDDQSGKLILSVHMYTPYSFAMESPGHVKYTESHKNDLANYFNRLNSSFIQKGYPVVIGEYGATNKNNLEDRVAWFTDFLTMSRQYGMTACLWDNAIWQVGEDNDYNEHYGYYNRKEGTWYFPEILKAIVNSTKN